MIKSLHGKIIIVSGVVASIMLVLFASFYLGEEHRSVEQFHTEILAHYADGVMESIFYEMSHGGMDSVRQIIERQAHYSYISDIKLMNSRAEIVASSSGLEGKSDIPLRTFDSIFRIETQYTRRRGSIMSVTKPIGNSSRCHGCHSSEQRLLGFLELDFRFTPGQSHSISFIHRVIGGSVIFLTLLAVSLWFFQHRFVRKPISNLMDAIQRAKDGDLTVQAGVHGSDEMSRLTVNFNQLISRLDRAQKELTDFHEREMENAERLATAGEIASGIAHEIKNPLAGMSSTIHVMLEDTLAESPNREIMVEMATQIKRIEKAVRDLLTYACPPPPEFKRVDVNENISRCVSFISAVAEKQGTSISAILDKNVPTLLLDSTLIDNALINITMNALQALKSNGNIRISSHYDEITRRAIVTIVDDGPGIPPTVLEKIFRPFYTTKHKGTGLGLSICKKSIECHMGTMEVESRTGVETRFVFKIPADATLKQLSDRLLNEKVYSGS
jgi:signal transduction histidine kinase